MHLGDLVRYIKWTHLLNTQYDWMRLKHPAHQVVRVCRLVCHEWKELVDSAAHWRVRCRREGIQSCDASIPVDDWCLFYFITKKGSNLLKNNRANAHKHTA